MSDPIQRRIHVESGRDPPPLTSAVFTGNARQLHRAAKAACAGPMPDLLALVVMGRDFDRKMNERTAPLASALIVGDGRATLLACCMMLDDLVRTRQTNDPRVVAAHTSLRALLLENMVRT